MKSIYCGFSFEGTMLGSLNREQQLAVENMITKVDKLPFILFGPPGLLLIAMNLFELVLCRLRYFHHTFKTFSCKFRRNWKNAYIGCIN